MEVKAEMGACFRDIVKRFEVRMKVEVKDADTPWLDSGPEKRYKHEIEQDGIYGWMAASPLMAVLYGARSVRPDLMIPTLRLSRRLTKWSVFDDRKLLRFLGYCRNVADLSLSGSLSSSDLQRLFYEFGQTPTRLAIRQKTVDQLAELGSRLHPQTASDACQCIRMLRSRGA